jgi:RHS repeat-associated protein
MPVERISVDTDPTTEEAVETAEHIRLIGGGIEHELAKDSGEAALISEQDGEAWVERETIVLERAGGGRQWRPVGGHRGARAREGRAVREVGDDGASCETEYLVQPGAPMKVVMRIRASRSGSYRLRWSLEGIRGEQAPEALERGLRSVEDGGRIEIDWSDVVAAHGEVVSMEANEGGAQVLFGPLDLEAGAEVELDPTIAGVSSDYSISNSSARRMARASDGTLHVAYCVKDSTGKNQIHVKESSNDGQTWSSATRVSTAAGQDGQGCTYVSMAVDSRDDLHVVYQGKATGYSTTEIWHAWCRDGIWQTPERISTYDGMSSYAQKNSAICVDAGDDLQVVWRGKATGYTSDDQIWRAACVRMQWQTPERISNYSGMDSNAQNHPSIVSDGAGDLHVTWNGKATGYTSANQIWHRKYEDGSWQTAVRISTYSGMDSYGQGQSCIALDSGGEVHVVWAGKATGYTSQNQIWYGQYTTSWQTPVRISTATGMDTNYQSHPSIAVDSTGQLHALWRGLASGTGIQVRRAIHDGSSWGTPTAETSDGPNIRPVVRWAPFHNRAGNLDWMCLKEPTDVSYETGGDSNESINIPNYKSQSFKATETGTLGKVELYMKETGPQPSATVTVTIYAADGNGRPTGASLGSATGTVTGSTNQWVTFDLYGQDIGLTEDSCYCIVASCGGGTLAVSWQVDASSPTYSDGNWAYSSDSGSSWTADTSKDGMFRVHPAYNLEFGNDTTVEPADVAIMSATNYWFDDAERQEAVVDAYSYDAAGQQESRLDPKGQRTTHVYDKAGRHTQLRYSDGTLVTLTYDNAGNRRKMQDSTGTTTYTYDDVDRLETVTYPANKTITHAYDAAGNRDYLIDPDGGRTTYSYDGRNVLEWLWNPQGERTTYQYDALEQVTTMTHANGATAATDYDADGQTTAVRNLKSDGSTVLSIFTYSYDNAGNRTGVQEANGDRVTWSYDENHQLMREQRSGGNSYDITYTYDEVGNRLTKVDSGTTTTYAYDAANQLETEETPTARTTYTYDANGNTATIDAGGSVTTYSWDIENHVTKVELPGGTVNTMSYAGEGKRRRTEDSDGLRNIIWDGENLLAETDSGDTTVAAYTLAPQRYGEPVSQRRSGATSFHHYDALGSTERLTDSSENTDISYLYKAFGQQTILSGSHDNPFTWVGRLGYYRQKDPADFWLRARIHNPLIGRFVSRDPVPNGNLYTWPGNSPTVRVDPSGMGGRRGRKKPQDRPTEPGMGSATAGTRPPGGDIFPDICGVRQKPGGSIGKWTAYSCTLPIFITGVPTPMACVRDVVSPRFPPPPCCRWDMAYVFCEAFKKKCAICDVECGKLPRSEGDYGAMITAMSHLRCMMLCMGGRMPFSPKIHPWEEYWREYRECVKARSQNQ